MYLPEHFDTLDATAMRHVMDTFPLATLVTQGPHGPEANHVPLIFEPHRGPNGTLIGHIARDNDLWHAGHHPGESLAIFHAVEGYISPNWYPSKAQSPEVVPTWNYLVVHAHGPLIVHKDEKWLLSAAGKLTKMMEARTSEHPWKMADAPLDYIRHLLANIVGIEIPVTRIVGKAKLSQNRTIQDRIGAAEGLRQTGDPRNMALAEEMTP